MPGLTFPGGLSELDFVDAYRRSALRKPQMAADAALRALVFSDMADRAILCGVIAQELAEACRRLVAVYSALADRRYSIARSLMKPLPTADDWCKFVDQAGKFNPGQIVWDLSLGEDALEFAEDLRGQPGLADLTGLVRAAETGSGMLLVPHLERRNVPTECWFAGIDAAGEQVAASLGATEHDAIALADSTANLSEIARGFLSSYLGARRTAGRRD
ncbi:MAG: hypothetical protein ACRDG3_09750 [Tepidiformaceae bacterium]